MKPTGVFFSSEQFNRLHPFYIQLDKDLLIESYGKSIEKIVPGLKNKHFGKLFKFIRPFLQNADKSSILDLVDQLIVIEIHDRKVSLRGQLELLEGDKILFIGSPWFGSMEQVREHGLHIKDFAFHDPLIDLLHVLKTQEITNLELKELLQTVNKQKNDLKNANRKVEEIAMFPNENPDPRFRINFEGEILMTNPVADLFDHVHYKNKFYPMPEFWQHIAKIIEWDKESWTFEASVENEIYSFICRPLVSKGYVNIYGRNISIERRNEEELQRLSLVASANKNGIVFTDQDGKIYWVNQGFTELTGYETKDIVGKTPVEVLKGELTNMDQIRKMVKAFEKGDSFNIDVVHYRKDGSWFWGRSQGQAVRHAEGEPLQYFAMVEDITAEKALQERLEILSKIAEDNINAVVITDKEGRITWVNKSFTQLSGYNFQESLGRKPGHMMQGPDTDPDTVAYLRKQIRTGEPFAAEILNYDKHKVPYWLRILGQPIYSSENELTGFFALEQDITRERQINAEIKEAENKFLTSLQKIGDNVWDYDLKTATITFSKSTNELLGIELSENIITQQKWWESVHLDDVEKLVEQDEKYKKGEIDSNTIEYRLKQESGRVKWVLDRSVVIEKDSKGLPLRIVGIHTDITSIKLTEKELENRVQQFKSLSENIPAVVYEYEYNLDGTENFRYISPAVEEIFGITADEFRKGIIHFIHEEDQERFATKSKAARDSLQPFIDDSRLVIPGRGVIWQSVSSSFSYFAQSGSSVFTGIISDITQQKELENNLVNAREEAMKLARTKEAFLANMSHEIRTPLNGIIGMIRELAKMDLSSKQKMYVNNAGTASQHLLSIINNILDLSKIEAGSFDLEKKSFDLRQLLGEVESIMKNSASENLIDVHSTIAEDIAHYFLGDAPRIRQILINIIGNSIKFTENGTVNIECKVIEQNPTTQIIGITITDTGIGMDADFLETIFNKFSQEDEKIHRKFGGTGLGMAITYELIQLMQGEIRVSSKKGEGSRFDLIFNFEIDRESGPGDRIEIDYEKLLSGKRILLVEDNEMNRLVAINLLDHYNVITEEAIHGEDALSILQSQNFDLILMDLQMPVMDGIEATRLIRKQKITTPIVALTANAFKNEIDKCIDAGMNDFATKPFDEEVLLNTLVNVLPNEHMTEHPITPNQTEQKLYDLSRLTAMSRGKEEFVIRMTNIFCEQIASAIEGLKAAVANNDRTSINRITHKIKPSIAEMGISSIKDDVIYLESAEEDNSTPDVIKEKVNKVIEVLNKVADQLKTG